jgi:hypothetical protein
MYQKDSFKEDFEEWKDNLDLDSSTRIEYDHFDRSIMTLFLERNKEFENESALNELRGILRKEDEDIRLTTYTRPKENKIRDEF